MNIRIEPLQASDDENLLAFETENRSYFTSMIPDRGDDYYLPEIFAQRHQALLDEQAEGLSYFYLIKDEADRIIGRVNVTDINQSEQSGSIGYRVGESFTGRGIAKRALRLLIIEVQKKGIKKLTAQTTRNHIASQKVLLKNSFKTVEGEDEEVFLNDQKLQLISFVWNSTNHEK
ncbi:GNAT family N-acetyltransferase [Jeotgalibacillus salarius]|uniref:N-acetyltransferase n=1 Tax=Jeotgalibacillus salarius TaxID=546023 RepID=A0A4Y8LGQ6_9BACL|nr:GNAT family N-acetyltransferase [Jeotgalibacillus salarius]TFE01523.1 N-acetyltransferase [Jeotgalibacillus salarius]